MLPRVLFVDDDPLILKAFVRAYRGRFLVSAAQSGNDALALIRNSPPFAVIVADMRMPGMDGIELLQEVKILSPDTTRIMLTGESEQLTAVEAVNSGNVFRFLNKPCNEKVLAVMIEAGAHQHELVSSHRELLEQTLSGSVQVLVDLLAVFDSRAFGQAQELRTYALKIGARMGLPAQWDLGLAALLAPVGRMALPLSIQSKLNWGEPLSPDESAVFDRVPENGARIVGKIPRLHPVARIILYAAKDYNGQGHPDDGVRGVEIPLESRILHVLSDFLEGLQTRRSRTVVLERLKLARGKYDPAVLTALGSLLEAERLACAPGAAPRLQPLRGLEPGMCLVEDLCTPDGALVLAAGTRIAQIHLERLRSVASMSRLAESVLVVTS